MSDGPDDRSMLGRVAAAAKDAATGAAGYVVQKRFGRTPAGKARKAAERGASTFHIRLRLDDIAYAAGAGGGKTEEPDIDDVVGGIEGEGWQLDNVEYLTETETWERTDADGSVTRGSTPRTFAVLLFRRSGPAVSPDRR